MSAASGDTVSSKCCAMLGNKHQESMQKQLLGGMFSHDFVRAKM